MLNRHDVEAIELKALGADAEPGSIEGYASVFGVVDQGGDRVNKGAFAVHLEKAAKANRTIPMLWQHDRAEPIGVWNSITEDSKGLKVSGRLLVEDDPLAKRAYAHVKAGSIGGMSIGYRVEKLEPDPKKPGVYDLKELDLREVSLVTMPMLLQARITAVKSVLAAVDYTPTTADLVEFLKDVGGYRPELAQAIAQAARPHLADAPAAPPELSKADAVTVALARMLGAG